jgi:hypothetical protein
MRNIELRSIAAEGVNPKGFESAGESGCGELTEASTGWGKPA